MPLARRPAQIAALAAIALLGSCVPREENVVRLRASFWSPPGVEEQIAHRFEATHPGVKIDLLVTGGRYAEKLQSMIVAGNEPDILMAHDTFFHDWAARNVFADLTDFVQEQDRADPFLPVPLEAFTWGGRAYAIPIDCNAMVAFGNLDAAANAKLPFPWKNFTWAEFEKLGPRLSRRGGNPDSPTEYLCALPPPMFFLTAFGARCFDDPHHPHAVIVESDTTIAAFEFWRRMHQRGWAVPRSMVADQGESEMFRDGRIAFLFWARSSSKFARSNAALHWDVAPLPAGPAGRSVPHLSIALGISRRTKHADLAREYLRFYVSDAGISVPVNAGQIVPVRRRQAFGDLFLKQNPPASMRTFAEPLEENTTTALAYCPGRFEVEDFVTKRLEQSLAEPSTPTTQIVAALGADLRDWLKRMQEKGLL